MKRGRKRKVTGPDDNAIGLRLEHNEAPEVAVEQAAASGSRAISGFKAKGDTGTCKKCGKPEGECKCIAVLLTNLVHWICAIPGCAAKASGIVVALRTASGAQLLLEALGFSNFTRVLSIRFLQMWGLVRGEIL